MRAKTIAEILNEGFGQKDLVRMQDIMTKSDGNHDKEISLATTQANIIKDAGKAKARAEAAEEIFGVASEIAQIFHDRAKELGGSYVTSKASNSVLAPVTKPKEKGEKLERKFQTNFVLPSENIAAIDKTDNQTGGFTRGLDPKASMRTGAYADMPEIGGKRISGPHFILPLGRVNLGSGESKFFNVHTTWDDEGIVEVWKSTWDNKYKLIFTSGDKPYRKLHDVGDFKHDQTWAIIGRDWMLVDYVPLAKLSELIRKYGSSLPGYVYK
jgi:hypothetical protein